MKRTMIGLLAACARLVQARAAESSWETNLPKAQDKAKAENKMVLLDFTGSDWCGWCIKFDKEVFATKEFKEYAEKNLVLVQLDFPSKKPQADELKKANAALQSKYSVNGFPTLVVLDKDGKEIGRQVGYLKGGPDAFIAKIKEFANKK